MNQPVDPKVDGFVRYRANLAYDGTNFAGWAKQPGGLRTVLGELLLALETIFGESETDFGVRVAGRTDAGVHAYAQVIHFDLTNKQLKRLGRGPVLKWRLNSLLPDDIRIHEIMVAPPGFDARFSAAFRRYRYRIADDQALKDPLKARYTLWHKRPLDTFNMQAAALELRGLHDFASFCKARVGATTIREVREINISRNIEDGNVIEVELLADAFCHNMVRAIMGALIAVGEGKAKRTDVARILKQTSRVGSFKVALPQGLTLLEIGYPPDDQLASQAEMAKNLRSLDEN